MKEVQEQKNNYHDYNEAVSALKAVIFNGDLSRLKEEDKLKYYEKVCSTVGLNPFTKPFEFINLNGKMTMYANKSCAEQLRKIYGISCQSVEHKKEDGFYIVKASVIDKTGRTDTSTGVCVISENLRPADMANLIMKTETKAKRRATLSLCGLSMLDETELDTVKTEKDITPRGEYKIVSEEKKEVTASVEQIDKINALTTDLKKEDGYIASILMKRYGHSDLSSVPSDFADKWILKLEEQKSKSVEAAQ